MEHLITACVAGDQLGRYDVNVDDFDNRSGEASFGIAP